MGMEGPLAVFLGCVRNENARCGKSAAGGMMTQTSRTFQARTLLPLAIGLFVLVACGQGVSAAERKLTPADEKGLLDAEQVWVRSLMTGDVDLLGHLVDEQFSFIGPDGTYEDREAYLAGYRALPGMGVKVESVDLHDVHVRLLGDTGIVTGRVVARVRVNAEAIVENVRFTRVYRRRGGRWRMAAGQGTRIPETPESARP
jgi:ketosteroid isomerase-like protein